MFDVFGGFNANKLKPQLKMAVSRFNIASNKKTALLKQNMRAVAVLLAEDPPKEEKARIKAEALIRDDDMIEAFEILQLECELLSERIKLIDFCKECPPDLVSCIATLIYAAPRVDIPELQVIRKQFRAKYGKQFEEAALNNAGGVLNERVVTKLSIHPPAAFLVQTYLEKICEQFEVDWSPQLKLTVDQMCEPMAPPIGFSVPVAQGTGLGSAIRASTGQEVYPATSSKQDWADPPQLPTAMATPYTPPGRRGGGGGGGDSSISGSSTIATTSMNMPGVVPMDDFSEPDIFIPAAPGAKTTTSSDKPPPSAPPSAPAASPGLKQDDDDDKDYKSSNGGGGDSSNGGGGAGSTKSSYHDLAARFDNLKKL